jgi:putative ABC transport system substrate-binding protein
MTKVMNCLMALAIFLGSVTSFAELPKVKVYVNQFVQHPALDSTAKGIIDGLANLGYLREKNLDLVIESSQGNPTLSAQIANNFAGEGVDVAVGIATISSQSLSKYARENKIKLVFTSVTDPIGANLIQDLNNPKNNTSGVSNFVPLEPQIEMFKLLKPSLKKLGFLYNSGELNSLSLISQLEKICPKYGIELVTIPANRTSEVSQSSIKLAGLVDAIFISNDNTALSSMRVIIKSANQRKIPVFVSDTDIVEQGALAALGPNQYEIGLQTASIIARVLGGEDVNKIVVEFPKKTELYINAKSAKILDIEIPEELKTKAAKIIL